MMYALLQFVFLWTLPPYRPLHIEAAQLFNPMMFGIISVISCVLFFTSMRLGSTALSTIINNFSMLVPITFGLIFLGETITKFQIAGIILVLATLFFFSIKEKNDSDLECSDKKKHSFKWLTIAVFAAFFTGCALVFSKRNALTFANYFKEYLILLNAVTVLASLPYIFWAAAKKKIKLIPDIRFLCSVVLMAIINDVYNIIYMIIVGKFSSAFFFPVASVVATIFVVLCSRLFLKEKLSGKAYVGILLIIIAITLLSL